MAQQYYFRIWQSAFSETFWLSCSVLMLHYVFHHQLEVAMPKKKAWTGITAKELPPKNVLLYHAPTLRVLAQVPVKLPKVPVSSSFFGVSVSTDVPQSSVSSRLDEKKLVGLVMASGFSMVWWVFKEGTSEKKWAKFSNYSRLTWACTKILKTFAGWQVSNMLAFIGVKKLHSMYKGFVE